MDDLISRQAAIDEIEYELEMINLALDSITLDFNTRERLRQRKGEAREILNSIQQLPSAQPYTENDYIAEFIKERHPYMLDSFSFSAWKLKRSWYNLCKTFKDALQQRGTVVTCGIDKCKHNDDGLCKAESIYLSEDHDCDGGCDDGWVFDEKEEFED